MTHPKSYSWNLPFVPASMISSFSLKNKKKCHASSWHVSLYIQVFDKYLLNEPLNECCFVLFCFCSRCYWKNTFSSASFFKFSFSPIKAVLQGIFHSTYNSESFPIPMTVMVTLDYILALFHIVLFLSYFLDMYLLHNRIVCLCLEVQGLGTYIFYISFSIDKA